MADKPNKSNKPVNGQIPKHIEEALAGRDYATSYEHLSSKDDYRGLEDKIAKLEAERRHSPNYFQQDLAENIAYAEQDLANLDKVYHDKQNEQLANTIGTYTKTRNINERTTTMSSQHRFYKGAKNSADMYLPSEMVEARIQSNTSQVNQLGMEVAGRMRELGTDEVPNSLLAKTGQITGLEEQIAADKRLLKVQNKAGLSTEKLFGRAEYASGRTNRYFEDKSIQNKVASHDVRNIEDEEKALGHMNKNVAKLQSEHDSALESGSKKVVLFAEKLDKATAALDKQQKVVEEMNRQGISGPGGGGRASWGDAGMIAAMAGRATAFAARGTRQMVVDNDIREMSMKTKFASMGNQIYQRADEAIMGGNMDSLLELTGGSMNFAKNEAMFNKNFTNKMEAIGQVGDLAEGTGNVIQSSIDGGKAAFAHGAIVAGASQGAIELTKAGVKLDTQRRGLYGGEKAINSWDTSMGLSKQMRMMDSKMMQSVYDQGMTTYNSVTGLGNAAGIQSSLMNTGTLGGLANVGLTPEKAAQLTAGMKAAGAMSSEDAMRTLTGAGAAKQRGILGQEEYVGMAAQLMGAGGGAGDMESIMAAAVAAGMDNSKSIGELVSGTLALSQGLTGMGVSATTSTQGMLTGASQALIAAGVDPNLAANAAASSIGNYNQSQGSRDFTLGNIMERSSLRKQFGGKASIFQLNRLSEMTTADHKVFLDAANNPNNQEMQDNANQLAKAKGVGNLLNPDGKGFDLDVIKNMTKASFTASAMDKGALGSGIDIDAIFKKADAGGKLTDKEMAFLGEYGGGRGEAIISAIGGHDGATKDPNTKAPLAGSSADVTRGKFKTKELTDAEAKGGAKMDKIFESLEETLKGVQENVGPEKIGKMVEDAASKFETPILEFQKGSDTFNTAVDKFIKWQNSRMGNIQENGTKTREKALKEQENSGRQFKLEDHSGGAARPGG